MYNTIILTVHTQFRRDTVARGLCQLLDVRLSSIHFRPSWEAAIKKQLMHHLRVFIDEHEGIGDIVVSQMNNRGADPGGYTLLALVQDGSHGLAYARSLHVYRPSALHTWR